MQLKNSICLFIVTLCLFNTSCVTYKNIPYFKDVSDSANILVSTNKFVEPLVQYDDILSISISTLDIQSNVALNMPSASMSSSSGASALMGGSGASSAASLPLSSSATYRVNSKGEIDLPLIGKLHVGGLTTKSVKDTIQIKLSEFYKIPTVDVRFANFRITVLGEVQRPGTYSIPNEKITIFDALGLSGDLTIFGKRENILIIRDSGDKKNMVRLDLKTKSIVSSSYFYLKQNDVIYVEPTQAKIAILDSVQNKYIAIASAVLSVLIILATRLK